MSQLAQWLRGALGKLIHINTNVIGGLSTVITACHASLSSLAEGIALMDDSSPSHSQVSRLHTLVDHVANRTKDIQVLDGESKCVSEIQVLMDELLPIQQRLNGLQWVEGSDTDEVVGDGREREGWLWP